MKNSNRIAMKSGMLLLALLLGFSSFGQGSCCLTNSLNVSTGIDPTGTAIAIGAADPKWTVIAESADMATRGGGSVAYSVGSYGSYSQLSCIPSGCFVDNLPGENDWMTFQRCFYLCQAAYVTFNLTVACDDWATNFYVSGHPLTMPGAPGSLGVFPQLAAAGSGITPSNVTQTIYLPAGMNCISITANNWPYHAYQCFNLSINGTITTATPDIISETGTCSPSWPWCIEPPIIGPTELCAGTTINLTDAYTGGTWTSSDNTIATISSTGLVTGVNPGIVTISYTDNCGRVVTTTITVDASPVPIAGPSKVCVAHSITLSDATGGGSWSTNNGNVNVIGGLTVGLSAGTTIITYAIGTCSVTTTVTVYPTPTINPIPLVCLTSTVTLTAIPGGGTWVSSLPGIATIGLGTGLVTGISPGTTIIYYTSPAPAGCYTTGVETVNPTPTLTLNPVCAGLTVTALATPPGGTWSTAPGGHVTIGAGSGIMTGISQGTSTITYFSSAECRATGVETVYPIPSFTVAPVCAGSAVTFTAVPTGGTWISTTPGVGTIVLATGVFTGVSGGTSVITYTSTHGCPAHLTETVHALPVIGGTLTVCVGKTTNLSGGGTWTSGNIAVATVISTTGLVTGVAAGTATISLTSAFGCLATAVVTVNLNPTAFTGNIPLCIGGVTTLNSTPAGGTWSTTSGHITLPVGTSGVVTGTSGGTAIVTYTSLSGCTMTGIVTVNPTPTINVIPVCVGITATLTATPPGGTWASGTPSIGTIDPTTGVVGGISAGTTTIKYVSPAGCTVKVTETVNPLPGTIKGDPELCQGASFGVSDNPFGGTWSSSPTTIATMTGAGPGAGTIHGHSAGTATITYTLPTGCIATIVATVNPTPTINVVPVCVGGVATFSLTPVLTGGTWSSVNTTVGTIDPTTGIFTGIAVGTTTISYTTTSGCTDVAVETVMDAPVCVCDAGVIFREIDPTNTGIVAGTGALPVGNYYYLNHDITITAPMTMNAKVVVIGPGVKITVAPTVLLTLNNSHLFCCPGNMWQGIYLDYTSTSSARMVMRLNSLIEDAITAVEVPFAVTPTAGYTTGSGGTNYILDCDGAVFNKNITGIYVHDYLENAITPSAISDLHPSYPFLVRNTVFTTRNFYPFNTATTAGAVTVLNSWPFTWPAPDGPGTGTLKKAWASGSSYLAPYNIDNPVPYPTSPVGGYFVVPTNYGGDAINGIRLTDVGSTAITTVGSEVYSSFVTGGGSIPSVTPGTTDPVMYDHLHNGIYAMNSNLIARNSIYQHIYKGPNSPGVAIYEQHTTDPTHINNLYGMNVYGYQPTGVCNRFYDCAIGVLGIEMYYVKSEANFMISPQSLTASGLSGNMGYDILSSNYYDVQINKNYIVNLTNAINYVITMPPAGGAQLHGEITFDANHIMKNYGTGIPAGTFVQQAVSVQNLATCGYVFPGSQVRVTDNFFTDVFNGAYVANFMCQTQPIVVDNNHITLDDATGTGYSGLQTGVEAANIDPAWVTNNRVTGPGYNVPPPPSASGLDYGVTMGGPSLIEGIHAGSLQQSTVGCNTVTATNTGYFFGGTDNVTWVNNVMKNNAYGYVLDGVIGEQGDVPTNLVCNNQWLASGGFTWTGMNYQTYVMTGNTSTSSQLDVDIVNNPINDLGDFLVSPPDIYGCTFGLSSCGLNLITGTTTTIPCPIYTPAFSVAYRPVSVKAATKQLDYTLSVNNKDWIGQYNIWKMLNADSTLADSLATLQSFRLMGMNSRYKHLKDIEEDIMNSNFSGAVTKLGYGVNYMATSDSDAVTGAVMADDSNANNVVNNYRQYYQLLIKYAQNSMTATDSVEVVVLANKCPFVDGTVVYQARTLFHHIFKDSRTFSDIGCEPTHHVVSRNTNTADTTKAGQSAILNTGSQQYSLSPNPSEGNIMLKQRMADGKPVIAEIWNAAGESIYKGLLHFEGGTAGIQLNNSAPGLYLLQLVDSSGKAFTLKFVVSK